MNSLRFPGIYGLGFMRARLHLIAYVLVISAFFAQPTYADDIRNELITAVGAGDVVKVRTLLKTGANVNSVTDDGVPLLIMAITDTMNLEMVQLLIAAKANVNQRNQHGETALIVAAARNVEITRMLIAAKAEINAKDNEGRTALTNAANAHSKDAVRLLIASKANVNAKDKQGKTVLRQFQEGLTEVTPDESGIGEILRRAGAKE